MPTQTLREPNRWAVLALRAKRAQGSVDRCAVARPVERARPPRPAYDDRCESGLSSGKRRSDRAERTARVRSCQALALVVMQQTTTMTPAVPGVARAARDRRSERACCTTSAGHRRDRESRVERP